MSRVDELIAELCPRGVRFVSLGEGLRNLDSMRRPVTKSDRRGGNYPYYGANGIQDYVDDYIFDGVCLLVGEDGSVKQSDGRPVLNWAVGQIWVNNHAHVLQSNLDELDLRFVYFYLQTIEVSPYVTGSAQPKLNQKNLNSIRIPVPPLDVQREIVRILDQFTSLEAELEAELEARRSQWIALANNFAVASRDQSNENAQSDRVKLESIARESVEAVKVQAEQTYVNLGVKWNGEGVLVRDARPGNSIKAATLYRAHSGQLIYNRMFVVEGSIALVPDECDGAVVSGEFPLFELDTSRVEPAWLLQHLCDPYMLKRIESEVTGTERGSMKSRRRWRADQFVNFEISLPSLEIQQEVLRVLRSGDALIRSLEDELAARRKQYEYYRDKLLTFEEAAA